ncbi:MAG: sporulation initiation factor Spo0A C-terminal domain-containing protein [Lachnospiraceae bacterium]
MKTKELYQKIAEHYGVNRNEVEREIKTAITAAFTNPQNDGQIKHAQQQIPRKDEIPTPEELIFYLYKQAKEKS